MRSLRDEMPEIDPDIPTNAVSIYGADDNNALDEFPVLKAFQQYIDAEQAKARKRMVSLAIFFGLMMALVIGVFVYLLCGASIRNQELNDKLLNFVMSERDKPQQVVQSDSKAIDELTAKIEEMQRQFNEALKQQAEQSAAQLAAAQQAAARITPEDSEAKRKTEEELRRKEAEIIRLKAIVEEKEKAAATEREKSREAELEAYRRKYYPQYYEKKEEAADTEVKPADKKPATKHAAKQPAKKSAAAKKPVKTAEEDEVDPIEALLSEIESEGISYFDDEDDEEAEEEEVKKPATKPENYSIPVDVKGNKSKWRIPNY